MSSYRALGPKPDVISASGAMTGTSTITGEAYDVGSLEGFAFQPVWTGTPTGTFTILASLDGVNFDSIGASIPQNPAGSAGNTYIPIYASCAKYLKLSYTNASGTGTLTCTVFGKTRG
jgi:hypothetical protein